ncbi:hypothetical protein D9M68_935720 [compost metagenome]
MEVTKIEVGPSAPPIIAMEAASLRVNSSPGIPRAASASAPIRVPKIPNCAAAPSNRVFGLASIGPKSVMAPTPRKISSGKILVGRPTS